MESLITDAGVVDWD